MTIHYRMQQSVHAGMLLVCSLTRLEQAAVGAFGTPCRDVV